MSESFDQKILGCIYDALGHFGVSFRQVVFANWNQIRLLREIDIPSHPKEFSSLLTETFGQRVGSEIQVSIVRKVRSTFDLNENKEEEEEGDMHHLASIIDFARSKYHPEIVCNTCQARDHEKC